MTRTTAGIARGPLLETKLHVPRRRRAVVRRPRLRALLSLVRESVLTLVSAPAGFGKTTLITEWLATDAAGSQITAWLSLDPRDNDASSFWTYVVAALQAALPGVGGSARSLLESAQSMETVIGTLLNELSSISDDVVLVLDDFHVIEAADVQNTVAFFLDHLPPQIHVVIASRADPALPLARMRARGELVEIRAADLRFTRDEAAAYFTDVMGLALTHEHVAVLEARTEGWIAALQLAALSLQGRDDTAAFIADFAGDDRFIVDYLVGEVLERQPSDVRSFLLRTSILDRFTGSLCDALSGGDDGTAMLEALDRGNLFVVALDDHRHWYRYHHLFGDMLRARLLDEQPALVPELHRRASSWYEQHADRRPAIRHAIVGGDFAHAADLIEMAAPTMRQARQDAVFRRWLEDLPYEVFNVRPVLAIGYVGALMATGEVAGVEPLLQVAERWADLVEAEGTPSALAQGMVVSDEAGFRSLRTSIGMYRAGQARLLGDLAATMHHAHRVLDLAGEEELLERGAAASLLGLAYWANGDLEAAYRWYEDGMASLEKAGHEADLIAGAVTLGDIRIAQGRLGAAMSIYERGLRRATRTSTALRGTPDMHVGIAELLHERNDLDGASEHLAAAADLGEGAGFPQNPYRRRVVMARVRQAQGDLSAAVDLLDEAEPLYNTDFSPEVRPVPAVRARVHLAQGRSGDALRWAQDRGLAADDELFYVREYEHITLARILVAHAIEHDTDETAEEAGGLLDRLLAAAEERKRTGSVIEILALRALLQHARRDVAGALASLERSLALAEPEGYARVFLDEGPAMIALMRTMAQRGPGGTYAHRLLASGGSATGGGQGQRGLVEPLSERELDVLRLLRSDLDGPDIARELMVSLNTMRTHTKSIYAKLGVNSRRAAVRRAEELGL